MSNRLHRRAALAAIVGATTAALAAPALAWHDTVHRRPSQTAPTNHGPQAEAQFDNVPLRETDFVLGDMDAPVTLIKYASLTCPHCADFHAATAAELKHGPIPEGRVRYVHRHFPLDQSALVAAMLLHCGNGSHERYFALLDILYTEQRDWAGANDPVDALRRIAARTGLNAEEFATCLTNQPLADRILAERAEGAETFGVRATPTLLINGARYSGNLGFADVETIIDRIS